MQHVVMMQTGNAVEWKSGRRGGYMGRSMGALVAPLYCLPTLPDGDDDGGDGDDGVDDNDDIRVISVVVRTNEVVGV